MTPMRSGRSAEPPHAATTTAHAIVATTMVPRIHLEPMRGHPDAAAPSGDLARHSADAHRVDDSACPGVHARHGPVDRVRPPPRPFAASDAAGPAPPLDRLENVVGRGVDRYHRIVEGIGDPQCTAGDDG